MNTNRNAAVALVAGSLAGLVTMVMHPTGHDVINNASAGSANTLNSSVHLLAIVAQPLVMAGALAVTMKLRAARDLAIGAYAFFAFGSVAVIIAAVASGFIAPGVLRHMASADAAQQAAMLDQLRFTGLTNQAFATVYVTLAGIAIFLWSIAIVRGREMRPALGVFGLVLGTALFAGVTTGKLPLDIHGFGAVVIGVGAWFTWAARELVRG